MDTDLDTDSDTDTEYDICEKMRVRTRKKI